MISVRGTMQSRTLRSGKSRAFWKIFISSSTSPPCGVLSMEDWTRSSRSTLVNVPSLLPSSILTPRRRRKRRESRVEKRLMGHRTM